MRPTSGMFSPSSSWRQGHFLASGTRMTGVVGGSGNIEFKNRGVASDKIDLRLLTRAAEDNCARVLSAYRV